MEASYNSSWIAFRTLKRSLKILALASFGGVLLSAETLTGVLYFNELGNGIHPAGNFSLAVGKTIRTVQYGEPLERHFKREICNDIGAIWSVDITRDGSDDWADRVRCDGQTDNDVHTPYLLVWRYLEGLAKTGIHSIGLSERYRSSPQFLSFARDMGSDHLTFPFGTRHMDQCLGVESVSPQTRTRFATHCTIELKERFVTLLFDVVRNKKNGNWEIDGIEMD